MRSTLGGDHRQGGSVGELERVPLLELEEVGEGIYQAALTLPEAGAWYLHVQSPSLGRRFAEENYTSLRVLPAATSTVSENDVRNLR